MNATLVIAKKLKALIARLTRQISYGVRNGRKYILRLIDLENQLEAMNKTELTFEQKVAEIIRILAEESAGGYIAKLWQKHGKNRIYVSRDNGRRLNGYGYIDIDDNWDCSTVDGWARHWATAAVREVIGG